MRWLAGVGVVAALSALCLGSGCSSIAYYGQSVGGHLDVMRRARPIADWLADPSTPLALARRLQVAQQARRFAAADLALPDNASYTRYADLGRSAVVWNVVAAPALSLTLSSWCYPVMGCVGYRGYFEQAAAEAEGAALRAQGLEVSVYGVPAYSTLGWTNWIGGDPLLSTLVGGSEAFMVRLIFHELAHQQVYASGDTPFNESYATAVERLGLARWQAATGHPGDDPAVLQRAADFRAITRRCRSALAALYDSSASDTDKQAAKAKLMATMRAEYATLKAQPGGVWAGYNGYDSWFARANNASLALQAAYDGLVPQFEQLFHQQGRDFARFHAAVRRLAALPADQRHAAMATLQP